MMLTFLLLARHSIASVNVPNQRSNLVLYGRPTQNVDIARPNVKRSGR